MWIFFGAGVFWLCFYKALQDGSVSVAAPIGRLSILVTVSSIIPLSFILARKE